MATAYTPGLKVSAHTIIEKTRRLPLKGDVLVKEGDAVLPDTVVARAELPGIMQTVRLAEKMGLEPADLQHALLVTQGDRIEQGQLLARSKGMFGLFKSEEKSPYSGTLEMITAQGHLGIRQPPTPIERDAYVSGKVTRVLPSEGVVVECAGALVQGIFGVGGERQGTIQVAVSGSDKPLTDSSIKPEHRGAVVIGGSNVSLAALKKAAEVGVEGIVAGGVIDRELIDYLRAELKDPKFDIGVAITGQEPIPFTLVVTEGFGTIPMAHRTFELLKSLESRRASINGATQIRAGVIRPEVIVPSEGALESEPTESGQLTIGAPIRAIREPYFGLLGEVTGLPPELREVDSETMVRVLEARLQDGRTVTIPRANVELIEG